MFRAIRQIALVLALSTVVIGGLSGCVQKAPADLLADIEGLDRQLMEIRAAEYAPEEYGRFVKHWLTFKGRLLVDEDIIRWPWESNPLVADLRKIEEEGVSVAELAIRKRDTDRQDAETRLATLEQRAQAFTERVSQMGSR